MRRKRTGICLYGVLGVLLFLLPLALSGPKAIDARKLAYEKTDAKIVVLNYHKIDDVNIALAVAPQEFEAQMAYLKSGGYHAITPDQLVGNLKRGEALPPKPLLITFDDGYADNYVNAYPILKKYGFTATVFVVTDYLSRYPNYMTWDQAREMKQNGFTIASHTMSHQSLTQLSDKQIAAELAGSREALDYQMGKQPQYFAYPTGAYDLRVAKLVEDAGYEAAFTIKYGNVDRACNLFALERVPVFRTGDTFKSFLQRVRYIPIFERMGWIKS